MNRKLIAALAAGGLLLGAGGGVAAAEGQGAGVGGGGCVVPVEGGVLEFKNPGRMFQAVRDVYGLNPAEIAALGGATPGEVIALYCR